MSFGAAIAVTHRELRRGWRRVRPLAAVMSLAAALAVQAAVALVYLWPADPAALAPSGGPLVVADRDGHILASLQPPGGRPNRDHWVRLAQIPAAAVSAVLESEDHGFWDHRGVDLRGVVRAAWLDVRAGEMAYGGSTLTMQLARLAYTQHRPRSFGRKLREAIQALRIERALDKHTILEQWLNRAYFGNGAWGIDAASRLYFGKPASALSTGEVVLLVCLPRAPTAYDPIRNPGAARARRDRVLDLMVKRRAIGADEAAQAKAQPLELSLHPPPGRAPHFVRWVVSQLPPEVAARGGRVRTTLDGDLQTRMERQVRDHVASLADRNVDQAGVVVLDAASSQVLAWVGSANFADDDGQIDIVVRRRHPGSALKPFVYAAAIEAGDLPSTVAYDVRDVSPDYFIPGDDTREHGPVRYREALGSSYNFAAIHALERAGVTRVMTALRTAGVATLPGSPEDYGLRLALGAAKVRLLDLAAGIGFTVRAGKVRDPSWVISVDGDDGGRWHPAPPRERRVFSPTTAWLVMDMMADPEARRPGFGHELPFDLPWRVAAKTGTARGFADTVAVAATQQILVAAWAGTFDGTPTQGLTAMRAAAPLARAALLAAGERAPLTLPPRPDDLVPVTTCATSGLRPGPACPIKHDWAPRGRAPSQVCDWHRDRHGRAELVLPPALRAWAARAGFK